MAEMTSSNVTGARLEDKYVHAVYEKTAEQLAHFQHRAWPRVQEFIDSLEPHSLLADIGCGNGRYLEVNESVCKIGCDYSSELVQMAKSRGREVLVCDNMALPLREGCCDAVISIAVIHHFSSHERRVQAIRELARITRPGGRIMIYVWAFEQKHRKFKCQDVLVPWRLKEKKAKWRREIVDSDTISNSSSELLPSVDLSSEPGYTDKNNIKEPHANVLKEESQKFSLFKVFRKLSPSAKLRHEKNSAANVPQKNRSDNMKIMTDTNHIDKKVNNLSQREDNSKCNGSKIHLAVSEENNDKSSSILKWLGDRLVSIGQKKNDDIHTNFASTVSEKDLMYKQLVSNIMSGTDFGQDCDVMSGFEVREFPGSSIPLAVGNQVVEMPAITSGSIQCQDQGTSNTACCDVDSVVDESYATCQCDTASLDRERKVPSISMNSVQGVASDSTAEMDGNGAVKIDCDTQELDEDWALVAKGAIKNLEARLTAGELQNGFDEVPPISAVRDIISINRLMSNGAVVSYDCSLPLSPGAWESHAKCSRNSSATSLDSRDLALSDAEDMLDNVFSDSVNESTADHGYTSDLGVSNGDPLNCKGEVQPPEGLTWNCSDSGSYDCTESLQVTGDIGVLSNGRLSSLGSDVKVDKGSISSFSVNQSNGHCSGDYERLFSQVSDVQSNDSCQTGSKSLHVANENNDVLCTAQLLGEENGTNETLLKRFYHVFREGELMQLITNNVSCLHVIDCFYDHANWCVIAEKH